MTDIVENMLRLQDGVFVEHWDVLQPEATCTKMGERLDHPGFAQSLPCVPINIRFWHLQTMR